ncbi:MAG: type I-B CRISPR-associated protein Cas7/Cst2/DevR [Candidatus Omnitrophica bacterium]|nr:type I-B CRISPR-associated protein Cas7/Cst2/DevR [Candidatus Omnitrophota bacterium]
MSKGAITLTIVFEGMNLNRDEGVGGNIQTLKKLHRGDGLVHTFMSRQALRFAIAKNLIEVFGWKETEVTRRGEGQKTNQFDMSKANIIEYAEMDFFGYMYTIKGENAFIRSAVCKLTPAISLEKFSFDQSFNANHEMVKRAIKYGEEGIPNPWQTEDHFSLYKYSFVIDLDKLGKIDDKEKKIILEEKDAKEFLKGYEKYLTDKKIVNELTEGEYNLKQENQMIGKIILKKTTKKEEETEEESEGKKKKGEKQKAKSYEIELEINLPVEEKIKRITDFLNAIKTLSRGIQGNINSLSPLFVIGGHISTKTPLAHPLVELISNTSRRLNKGLIDYSWRLLEDARMIKPDQNQDQAKQGKANQNQEHDIIKGIVKEKFENGYEFDNDWKTPLEAIDELIKYVKSDEFKKHLKL